MFCFAVKILCQAVMNLDTPSFVWDCLVNHGENRMCNTFSTNCNDRRGTVSCVPESSSAVLAVEKARAPTEEAYKK